MAKAPTILVMLVNEEQETNTKYIKKVPTKGTKAGGKLRMRKYDPVLRKHCWFVQKKLPGSKSR